MDDLLKKMRALEERVHQLEEEKASNSHKPSPNLVRPVENAGGYLQSRITNELRRVAAKEKQGHDKVDGSNRSKDSILSNPEGARPKPTPVVNQPAWGCGKSGKARRRRRLRESAEGIQIASSNPTGQIGPSASTTTHASLPPKPSPPRFQAVATQVPRQIESLPPATVSKPASTSVDSPATRAVVHMGPLPSSNIPLPLRPKPSVSASEQIIGRIRTLLPPHNPTSLPPKPTSHPPVAPSTNPLVNPAPQPVSAALTGLYHAIIKVSGPKTSAQAGQLQPPSLRDRDLRVRLYIPSSGPATITIVGRISKTGLLPAYSWQPTHPPPFFQFRVIFDVSHIEADTLEAGPVADAMLLPPTVAAELADPNEVPPHMRYLSFRYPQCASEGFEELYNTPVPSREVHSILKVLEIVGMGLGDRLQVWFLDDVGVAGLGPGVDAVLEGVRKAHGVRCSVGGMRG